MLNDFEKFEERMAEVSKSPVKRPSVMLEAVTKKVNAEKIKASKKNPEKIAKEKKEKSVNVLKEMHEELSALYSKILNENLDNRLPESAEEIKSALSTLSESIETLKIANSKIL